MLPFRRPLRAAGLSALMLVATDAYAQPDTPPAIRFTLPPVTVTAQKEPADPQTLPVSVTAVLQGTLEDAAVRSVSEAAGYAPNTYFNEFTVRKLSNARFRGVGAGPTNPGVTSYIDGVP
jgi:outer membrane receptor protein involved in Fe transport